MGSTALYTAVQTLDMCIRDPMKILKTFQKSSHGVRTRGGSVSEAHGVRTREGSVGDAHGVRTREGSVSDALVAKYKDPSLDAQCPPRKLGTVAYAYNPGTGRMVSGSARAY